MTLQVSVINTRSTSLLGLIKLIRISIRTLLISSHVRIVCSRYACCPARNSNSQTRNWIAATTDTPFIILSYGSTLIWVILIGAPDTFHSPEFQNHLSRRDTFCIAAFHMSFLVMGHHQFHKLLNAIALCVIDFPRKSIMKQSRVGY